MAGTLEISEDLCWMPAGWVYDNMLERMALVLNGEDAMLANMLLQSRTDDNGGYCDLRMMDGGQLLRLAKAADDVCLQIEAEGASSFHDPSSYPGFVDQLRQLRQMLCKRVGERALLESDRRCHAAQEGTRIS